ncbi:uncharacterized protein TRIREDRAFT_112631 [Trichoderma reesei QM6a]|uniref:Predicted protein n=2 Tax=Hypocrea jecorina TaxID=51453 RepID=G0RXJ9_HYPJQ|nr:uncharacterized protein TRIREDRAFT_112631 [Trichoderma reesei QM6a]EGR44097.1 predicted protein [Trichoderma reesei QM6a]
MVSATFARLEERSEWTAKSRTASRRHTRARSRGLSCLPCFSRLSSMRYDVSTLNNFNIVGSLGLGCAYCSLAYEANEAREGSGGSLFPSLFTHACRYAERRRLGWGEKRWWMLRAVETLLTILCFSSVGWPHEMAAANSLQYFPQRGWMKAGRRCAGALEQARSCLAYQKLTRTPWGVIEQRSVNQKDGGSVIKAASYGVCSRHEAGGCCYGSIAGQVWHRWHTQNHANVVADDQSGLAEAPGDLPLEPQDLGCYAVAVL